VYDMGGYQDLLTNKDFVKFWIGGTISKLGDQLNVVAISWLALVTVASLIYYHISLLFKKA